MSCRNSTNCPICPQLEAIAARYARQSQFYQREVSRIFRISFRLKKRVALLEKLLAQSLVGSRSPIRFPAPMQDISEDEHSDSE